MEKNINDITNYIFISDSPQKTDVIIVPGTFQIGIIIRALEIFQEGYAPLIVTTGGFKKEKSSQTESMFQKAYLVKNGVPSEKIITEKSSTNTKENAKYSKQLLEDMSIKHDKIILISKTYHARRLLMTFKSSFTNSDLLIIPAIDDRNITADNWYTTPLKRKIVFEEMEKIGKYYLKGDLSL